MFSAFLVSGIASVALGLVFRELVRLDYSERIAQSAVLFLFIFPTSYFLHIPYTESLFLALALGTFLAARTNRWLLVGVLGFFACLTRINGLVLCPAILFEVWAQYRQTRKFNAKWLWVGLIPLGFGGYLLLNRYVSGEFLMFLTYQREHWFRRPAFPWWGIWERSKSVFDVSPTSAQMIGVQETLFVLIGLFAIIAGWRFLRPSYRVWMIINWLLFVSTTFVLSVPRYTLVLFPIFILMALAARRNWWAQTLFVVWSLLFLALFTIQYVKGWWAF